MTGAVSPKQYPKSSYPEFAFAGRSNVGKSSLIRSLLNRKKLVRTSSTPGKTQEINFFKINDSYVFADLPGYGFARVPAAVQDKWKRLIESYLLKRKELTAVVFIVDLRREPTALDLELKRWLEGNAIPYLIVATKSDKLSRSERSRQAKKIREAFLDQREGALILYSSKNNSGRKELWNTLARLASAPGEEAPKMEN